MSEAAQILVPTAGTAPACRPGLNAGDGGVPSADAAASQIAFINLLNSSLILPLAENNKSAPPAARPERAAPEARFEDVRERPQRSEVEPPSRRERDAAPRRAEHSSPAGERAAPEGNRESDRPRAASPENREAQSGRVAAEREPGRPLKAPAPASASAHASAPAPAHAHDTAPAHGTDGKQLADAEARVRAAATRAALAGFPKIAAQQQAAVAAPAPEVQARQVLEGQARAVPVAETPRHAQPERAPSEMKSLFAETAHRPAAEEAGLRSQLQRMVTAQQESIARQQAADKTAQPQAPAMSSKGGSGGAPQGGGTGAQSDFMAAVVQQAAAQGAAAQAKASSVAKGFAQAATAARAAQGAAPAAQSGPTAGAAEGARMPTRPASEAGSAQKAAPAREPAQADKLLRQVVKATKITISRGREEMRMLLKPERLGWLKVRIAVEGQKVTARLVVENQGVRDLLESNVRNLHQALQSQNLKVSQIVVDLQGDGGSQLRESDGGSGSKADSDRSPATEDTAPDAETGWPDAEETGDSLVDLRV